MNRRPFARTGLDVSEVVLGGGTVGGILVHPADEIRLAAMQKLVAAGIDWIDTAPMYGKGVSEETIGRHLSSLSPRPRISTKFSIAPQERGDIAATIERSLEQSLARLKLPRVELLQLHNHITTADTPRAISPDQVLGRGGVADTLDRLKSQGLIGASGITAAGDMPAILQVIGSGRFDCAQVYYNMINPSAAWDRAPPAWKTDDFSGLMAACKRQGMGVLNIRVYAGGALASPQRHGREYVMIPGADLATEDKRAAAVFAELGTAYGTRAQTALRFALANTDFACHVIGIADLAQFDEALAAVAMGPLPKEACDRLDALRARNFGLG
jgi:L-galactose dehydrogenase/L-glyceraldehyde 3-phosphate reductase